MIYHITTEKAWQIARQEGSYSPESLKTEGFIHCSDHFQLETVANNFYAQTPELIVLEIDPDQLEAKLVYEKPDDGEMPFPHIYGELNLDAVVDSFYFARAEDGKLLLPEGREHTIPELLTEFPLATPGKLFRSPTPGSHMFDPDDQVFDLYLQHQIQTVVALNDEEEHLRHTGNNLFNRYREAGFRIISAPIPDFSTPDPGFWDEAISKTIQAVKSGENTVIHCHAGIGRTGMFTALLASEVLDLDAEQSIAWVRKTVPYAIDTHNQKTFVRDEITRKRQV